MMLGERAQRERDLLRNTLDKYGGGAGLDDEMRRALATFGERRWTPAFLIMCVALKARDDGVTLPELVRIFVSVSKFVFRHGRSENGVPPATS